MSDKAAILRRAWAIAKHTRYETARRLCVAQGEPGYISFRYRPLGYFLELTPLDLSAALKLAWAEAQAPKIQTIMAGLAADYLARNAA